MVMIFIHIVLEIPDTCKSKTWRIQTPFYCNQYITQNAFEIMCPLYSAINPRQKEASMHFRELGSGGWYYTQMASSDTLVIERNRAHLIWSYHAPIVIQSLISDGRDSSFSQSRLYDFRNRGYTSPKNTTTASRITNVGRNMKIKRKMLNPRVKFCPRAKRRAMISRIEYIREPNC